MRESLFLTKAVNGKSYNVRSFDCCERLSDGLSGGVNKYELIDLKSIELDSLRDPAIIRRYINLVSRFMKIDFEETNDWDNLSTVNYGMTPLSPDRFMVFKIGKFLSNKHLVAAHTLIRYLWYKGHDRVVEFVLALDDLNFDMSIEDTFSIAHSFQSNSSRGLLGRNTDSMEGLIYFPPSEKYLPMLASNMSFNTVFFSNYITINIKIKIRGSFFDDSEFEIDSKYSLSALPERDSDNAVFISDSLKDAIQVYLKHKYIYNDALRFLDDNRAMGYTFRSFVIYCNNIDGVTGVDLTIGSNTSISGKQHKFTSVEELYSKLFKQYTYSV